MAALESLDGDLNSLATQALYMAQDFPDEIDELLSQVPEPDAQVPETDEFEIDELLSQVPEPREVLSVVPEQMLQLFDNTEPSSGGAEVGESFAIVSALVKNLSKILPNLDIYRMKLARFWRGAKSCNVTSNPKTITCKIPSSSYMNCVGYHPVNSNKIFVRI